MNAIIRKVQNFNNWAVFYILVVITVLSLAFSARSHLESGDVNWWSWADGAFQNFSTEMMGAIATFALFELIVGTRNEKKNLITQMGSYDATTAKNAMAQLRVKGWLEDGSLEGADLHNVNLSGADLHNVNLSGANLHNANLSGANLHNANLQNADLRSANLQDTVLNSANLQGADLHNVNLSGADLYNANLLGAGMPNPTYARDRYGDDILSTGSKWSSGTDMSRYTNPEHKIFWQPSWAKEQDE